mgnify:CR=1 FL=1
MNKRILIVAAHPDDEILGCGATVARLIREGAVAYTLILGEGITSRDAERNREKRESKIKRIKLSSITANKIIGVKKVFIYDFPDNRFDTIPLLDIIKVIEKIKNIVMPDTLFTHYKEDLNIDHQLTYKAVMAAARPLPSESVREIYAFEILSSTEWNYPAAFSPDTFFNVEDTIAVKLKAMKEYKTELKPFPHPRSLGGIKLNSQYWGMGFNLRYAEVFKSIRRIVE